MSRSREQKHTRDIVKGSKEKKIHILPLCIPMFLPRPNFNGAVSTLCNLKASTMWHVPTLRADGYAGFTACTTSTVQQSSQKCSPSPCKYTVFDFANTYCFNRISVKLLKLKLHKLFYKSGSKNIYYKYFYIYIVENIS
uniref:Uncharacterized protein n=1 Tax=Oryza brachyantha TaxID=4533 RepID=J3NEZ2_ORYBR